MAFLHYSPVFCDHDLACRIGLLGRDVAGRALFDTIHRGVGGTESELRAALDALRENYVVFMDSYGFYQLL